MMWKNDLPRKRYNDNLNLFWHPHEAIVASLLLLEVLLVETFYSLGPLAMWFLSIWQLVKPWKNTTWRALESILLLSCLTPIDLYSMQVLKVQDWTDTRQALVEKRGHFRCH
jgi:hypothetical protein